MLTEPGLTSLFALEGTWRLDREIVHADGARHRLEGRAVFRRSGPRLIQDEEGALDLGLQTGPIKATRRYIWARKADRLECYFDDMRPFHAIALRAAAPSTVHLCTPDRYEVAYDFTRWPVWRATWSVEGPRKRYVMTSTYSPLSSDLPACPPSGAVS